MTPEIIYFNGHFKGNGTFSIPATAVAIANHRFLRFGQDSEILALKEPSTEVIDLQGGLVIPGLNDSHIHLIRGGLNFNMELRWDGLKSLQEALERLKAQVAVTPPPQWVRVVGGWTEFQFKEKRMPTLEEINAVSKDTPVFILHLYDRALLNRAALRALRYTKETKELPGTHIERDKAGNPTGMLIATPNAIILYSALAQGPKLRKEDQMNSTLHFMRELNRFGLTSVVDAGGGFQNYPENYEIVQELDQQERLSIRIAYNLFTQNPNHELEDFKQWTQSTAYRQGNDYYRHNGAGEMLVFSAADFEDFLQVRPDLAPNMEEQLLEVVRLLVEKRWPFRMHATYDESISRALTVFEEVGQEYGLMGLNWFFDHAETISDTSIERVRKLGGGIAIQNRMAFQGEYFIERYGREQTLRTPPIQKIIAAGIPVGMGTDATRVSSYNPWLCLYWLVSGKSLGGTQLYENDNILSREQALTLYTQGSAWFSGDQNDKGSFMPGQLADFAVLSKDYFLVPCEEIKEIYSKLTVLGGKIVHASDEFKGFNPPLPPASPDWSPVRVQGAYGGEKILTSDVVMQHCPHKDSWSHFPHWGGCGCWAF